MTAREDMTLDRLRRPVRRGGAKLEQRVRKLDLPAAAPGVAARVAYLALRPWW
jgi:hypothetical protein